jgi:hypothetical protein
MEEDPFSLSGIAADALLAWIASAAGAALGNHTNARHPQADVQAIFAVLRRCGLTKATAALINTVLKTMFLGQAQLTPMVTLLCHGMRRDDGGRAIAGRPPAALSRVPSQNASRWVGNRAGAYCP